MPAFTGTFLAFGAIILVGILLLGGPGAPLARHESALAPMLVEIFALAATFAVALSAALTLASAHSSRAFWLAPLPPLAAWFCATGFACLERMDRIGMNGWGALDDLACLIFLVAIGFAFAAALLWTLRGGTVGAAGGAMAGLAGGSAAALILSFRHPLPLDLVDLFEHWTAMVLITATSALVGRIFSPRSRA